MTVPKITDRKLLRSRIRRALVRNDRTARFLVDRAMEDIETRLSAVSRRFPVAVITNGFSGGGASRLMRTGKVDAVFAMEAVAEAVSPEAKNAVVGDDEALPFAPTSLDLMLSPLSLQFANDLPGALIQIRQALRPDGLFLGSLLGGSSLCELRDAFTRAEEELRGGASPRFLPLADVRDLGGLLQRAGFALPVVDRDILTVRYDDALDLMRDLKSMGASNMLADRDRTPASRALLSAVHEIYRQHYSDMDGRIRATFEIISLSGWAPHESQPLPAKRGSADISLADFLGKD